MLFLVANSKKPEVREILVNLKLFRAVPPEFRSFPAVRIFFSVQKRADLRQKFGRFGFQTSAFPDCENTSALGKQLLCDFEIPGFVAESFRYVSVADWIMIKPVIDRPVRKFFALSDTAFLQTVKKAVINVNGPTPNSPIRNPEFAAQLLLGTKMQKPFVNCPHFARQIFDQSGVQACRTAASLYCA